LGGSVRLIKGITQFVYGKNGMEEGRPRLILGFFFAKGRNLSFHSANLFFLRSLLFHYGPINNSIGIEQFFCFRRESLTRWAMNKGSDL
jgi:hypothetical protein